MASEDRAEYDREGGQVAVEAAERHLTKRFAVHWFAVEVSDETVIVNTTDTGATAYTLQGSSNSVRILAHANAVLWDGDVALTEYENGVVKFSARAARIEARRPVDEFLDEPVPILERTDLVELESATEVDSDE